jgi:hypothetical protein
MGRPLKIAKAQAVLTVTDTAETGSIVTISGGNLTTSPTVGIAKGMSFIVATTVGGLTANTIYYVNSILSNTTFDVSQTQLSVQPQIMQPLTDTTGQSVSASFNVVDAYFNNPVGGAGFPTTNSNTYSVVGGNTAIIGKQVLAQVAIGINGTGTLYSYLAANTNASVFGVGTDLANLATGAALQVAVANNNGTTDYTNIGFASGTHGNITVAVANTTATGNVIRTSGNAQLLELDMPLTFDASFGGLTSGTTYFVKTVANATAFTVSATQGGAPKAITSNASVTGNAIHNRVVLNANCPIAFSNAAFVYANDEAGYIVRQKGKQKYLATGATSGLTAQCLTANVANTALTPNSMRILATYANSATQTVQSLSDRNSGLFTSTSGPIATGNIVLAGQPTNIYGYINSAPVFATFNSAIPVTVTAGAFVVGTTYTIVTVGNTNFVAIGATSNTVGVIFTATGAGSGTGTASNLGQPYPIVTIASA